MDDYSDIIDLPHPDPKRHPRMPLERRAFQLRPFAALQGFTEAIKKTTEEWIKKQTAPPPHTWEEDYF